jgi:hypothetical protein
MRRLALSFLICAYAVLSGGGVASEPQIEFTLTGEWLVTSSPINGEVVSRKGNTLGFPVRDMIFEEDGGVRTGYVAREDVGIDIRPLGVWRIEGNRFSAAFQLWCPQADQPCGSVVMRGEFTRPDRIRGTMTAFWDEPDETRPTGYDTWSFTFRGDRVR